jgi:hypothetical protein
LQHVLPQVPILAAWSSGYNWRLRSEKIKFLCLCLHFSIEISSLFQTFQELVGNFAVRIRISRWFWIIAVSVDVSHARFRRWSFNFVVNFAFVAFKLKFRQFEFSFDFDGIVDCLLTSPSSFISTVSAMSFLLLKTT